jgi:hypothetical protein
MLRDFYMKQVPDEPTAPATLVLFIICRGCCALSIRTGSIDRSTKKEDNNNEQQQRTTTPSTTQYNTRPFSSFDHYSFTASRPFTYHLSTR